MRKPNWPKPQPQPATPLRGAGMVMFSFEDAARARAVAKGLKRQQAKRSVVQADRLARQLMRLQGKDTRARRFGLKPHRNSRGIIWQGRAFYWSEKGYYRAGKGDRRPLQHLVWEHQRGRKMPPRHEIFFRDRDGHNFLRANLEMLSKEEIHHRIFQMGETRQPEREQRCWAKGTSLMKRGRERLRLLVENFGGNNNGEKTHDSIKFLGARRQTCTHEPERLA